MSDGKITAVYCRLSPDDEKYGEKNSNHHSECRTAWGRIGLKQKENKQEDYYGSQTGIFGNRCQVL